MNIMQTCGDERCTVEEHTTTTRPLITDNFWHLWCWEYLSICLERYQCALVYDIPHDPNVHLINEWRTPLEEKEERQGAVFVRNLHCKLNVAVFTIKMFKGTMSCRHTITNSWLITVRRFLLTLETGSTGYFLMKLLCNTNLYYIWIKNKYLLEKFSCFNLQPPFILMYLY